MNKYIKAAVFALSTALASPASGVVSDGNVCLYLATKKHEAKQALWKETLNLEKLLNNSRECSKVNVDVDVKGYYDRDSTGKIVCYRTDKSATSGWSVAHEYSLAGIDSVSVVNPNKVKVSLKDGKKRTYTLPDKAKAKKTQEVFWSLMSHYWALRA